MIVFWWSRAVPFIPAVVEEQKRLRALKSSGGYERRNCGRHAAHFKGAYFEDDERCDR